jgi:predicted SAM-dependent methyltransferase
MSNETGKSVLRRLHDSRFFNQYFIGKGIDIGAGEDSLVNYMNFFPGIINVKSWDLIDGDAEFMHKVQDNNYDFVHSSHCLEHMIDPYQALENWIRICKPNGHLIIVVPDEDLYEQKVWPSTYNDTHHHSFTINKKTSWSPNSVNLFELLSKFSDKIEIKKIELLDATYRHMEQRIDQTRYSFADSAIEIILKKL